MRIFTLLKKPVNLLAACLSMSLYSCADIEEETYAINHNTFRDIEVSEMGKWLSGTRDASATDSNMPVLHFRNEQVYHQTMVKLNEMSIEERDAYFKELGFKGAYLLWNQADEELEQIFDNADTLQMEKLIGDYKKKYERLFSFNTFDKYDATPYFSFTDNELSLVGNIKGYVVIGNELKAPHNNTPTYDMADTATVTTRGAVSGKNRSNFVGFRKAAISIENKNAKSTMTIGRIANSLAVLFNTKKKVALWMKRVKTDYSATLYLHSTKYKSKYDIVSPYGMETFILDLDIETIGNTFDADVGNFKCSIGTRVGRRLFHNIQVI